MLEWGHVRECGWGHGAVHMCPALLGQLVSVVARVRLQTLPQPRSLRPVQLLETVHLPVRRLLVSSAITQTL